MPDGTPDCGSPIAYLVLAKGTAVYSSARERIGTVDEVLFVAEEDVFDGIVVQTAAGRRFVDSDRVERIYERCVITTLTAEQAAALPEPEGGPPVLGVDPAAGTGRSLKDRLFRLFGRGEGWKERG
jgi:sporulation protein YlmC with PRC-barrel domain